MKTATSYFQLSSSQESFDEYVNPNPGIVKITLNSADDNIKWGKYSRKPKQWGSRHTLVLLGFLGFVVSSSMRVNLSIAIMAMVSPPPHSSTVGYHNLSKSICPQIKALATNSSLKNWQQDPDNVGAEFNWDGEDQGIILSAFFISYGLTHIPAGILAERVGGKYPFGLGLLLASVFCLLTPMAARSGRNVLVAVRIVQGFGEGLTTPAMFALLAKWIPPLERTKLGSLVFTGVSFGTVVTIPLCGILITSDITRGWPSGFYFFGLFGIIWFVFWTIFVFNDPSSHPWIDQSEMDYIRNALGSQIFKNKGPKPWRAILTSLPVWALLVTMIGHSWGVHTLLTELPTYMKTVLHFDLKSNGFWSAFPHFVHWVVAVWASWFSDYLRENNYLGTTAVRKIFNTTGHWIPAVGLICLAYSGCDRILAVTLLVGIIGINGAVTGGFVINIIDICPNYSAVLHGFTHGIASLCGIAVPYSVGLITKDGSTLENWRLIFLIAAGVLLVDNAFFLLFGEEQPWNRFRSGKLDEADNEDDSTSKMLSRQVRNKTQDPQLTPSKILKSNSGKKM